MESSTLRRTTLALASCLGISGAVLGDGPVVRDQSSFNLTSSARSSSHIQADDFFVSSSTRLTRAVVFISDNEVNDSGALESFSGELSWAIWFDNAGVPSTLGFWGSALSVTQVDTGLQDTFGDDIVAVSFELEHPVSLTAGATYWFSIHEGPWLSAPDGSEIWWQVAADDFGADHYVSLDVSNPGSWSQFSGSMAFVLYSDDVVWDQTGLSPGFGGSYISSAVTANDFWVITSATFSGLEAWIMDEVVGPDGGIVSAFSGDLSWAIYGNMDAAPDSLLDHGNCKELDVVPYGVLSGLGSDSARVRCTFGRSIHLTNNNYWLALHEGAWLSPYDGSPVAWVDSLFSYGWGQWVDTNEQAPGGSWISQANNSAFILGNETLFASGFEAGCTCAWSNSGGANCP